MSTRAWRLANRDKLRANSTRWRLRHPDQWRALVRAQKKRRRQRLKIERPEVFREQQRRRLRRRQERMAAIMETWRASGCAQCGERDPRCIDAHHHDPASKHASIANLISRGKLCRLHAELEKCTPLCANCHRKHHAPLA